jgi:hypothetical protein
VLLPERTATNGCLNTEGQISPVHLFRKVFSNTPSPDQGEDGEQAAITPPARSTGKRRALSWFLLALLTLSWAGLVNFGLDLSVWTVHPHNLIRGPLHMNTGVWVLNVLVVWVFVLFVLALVGRVWLALVITSVLALFIGLSNIAKLDLRNAPVRPSDLTFLRQPGFLVDMVGGGKIVITGVVTLLIIGACTWGIRRHLRRTGPRVTSNLDSRSTWLRRGGRLLVVCVVSS